MGIFSRLLGDPNKKTITSFAPTVAAINAAEASVQKLDDAGLRSRTDRFRKELAADENVEIPLVEALATIRESIRRSVNQRAYDVQLMAAMVLHDGKIAEQKTGEGKTLSAVMAAYVNALSGHGVHVVTVNDYLAQRDAGWYGVALHRVGISVGCITHEQAFLYDPEFEAKDSGDERLTHLKPVSRKEAYAADITYGTNNEFGFDYLRDNMVPSLQHMVQRGLHYAIVDEVDSILIDEARTPLIISAPAEESTERYYSFAKMVGTLAEGEHYNIDEKMRAATLTAEGISKMESLLGIANIYEAEGIETVHHIEQALRAKALFKRDKDYVVKDGEVIIVDEFTGRLMHGRRYSEGLHQAIEAKEGVEIKKESQTMATITFQNYFRMYDKLSGMTGTAVTEAEEFHKIYELDVVVVPTNRPLVRDDRSDSIYKTEMGKYSSIIREVKVRHELGQPILIGTISIAKNEILSQMLEREGIKHQLLNAKNHQREAMIITDAGKRGAVTVATNMAGRGVDIVLGGVGATSEEQNEVRQLGGLHVIGTERHESRRIDNQLRGRAGRQGDPGSSQFFVSMEDDLMRIFGSDRMKNLMDRLGVPDDMPIENKLISRSLESAQKKVEGHNFDIRKHLVEYDDVINKHREVIYKKRQEIITLAERGTGESPQPQRLRPIIMELVENELEQVVSFHTSADDESAWNLDEIYEVVETIFPVAIENRIRLEDIREQAGDKEQDAQARTAIIKYLIVLANTAYDGLEERVQDDAMMRSVEMAVYLRAIDNLWVEHLDQMSHLRQGIGLRGYGQQDPLIEYKKEAYHLFNELMNTIQHNVVYTIFKVGVRQPTPQGLLQTRRATYSAPAKTASSQPSGAFAQAQQPVTGYQNTSFGAAAATEATAAVQPPIKIGRNELCPCGSGKKYKKCGLLNTPEHQQALAAKAK